MISFDALSHLPAVNVTDVSVARINVHKDLNGQFELTNADMHTTQIVHNSTSSPMKSEQE